LANKVRKVWRSALGCLDGVYAMSRLHAYRADMEVVESRCLKIGAQQLPAGPAFVASQAAYCAAATLKRRLAATRKAHSVLRMENPVTDRVDSRIARKTSRITISLSSSSIQVNPR